MVMMTPMPSIADHRDDRTSSHSVPTDLGQRLPGKETNQMATYVGPNGRLYRKKRTYWKHLFLIAILCIAAAAMIGLR